MSLKSQFTPQGKAAISKILKHLHAAEAEFNTLSAAENHAALLFHGEGSSLNHCIRWGAQAAEEIEQELAMPG